jgi:hypothetical protein
LIGPHMGGGRGMGGRMGGSRPVSRVLSGAAIHLGCTSPCTSSDLPGNPCGPHGAAEAACSPIWSCSGWGLPCRRVLPPARCALTAPFHPCRPAGRGFGRSVFCGTFRGLASPRRYLAPCPAEPGLSSPLHDARKRRQGSGCPADSQDKFTIPSQPQRPSPAPRVAGEPTDRGGSSCLP